MLVLNNDQRCPIVNYDVYSEKFRGIHIDAMRECSADHPEDPIDCFTTTDIQFVLYNPDDPAVSLKHLSAVFACVIQIRMIPNSRIILFPTHLGYPVPSNLSH